MLTFRSWALPLVAVALWAGPGWSDDKLVPEEGAVQLLLLQQKSVREELMLTADETKKVDEFTDRQWKKAQEINKLPKDQRHKKFHELAEENEKFIHDTFKPEQHKRLDQIAMQTAGLLWATHPSVAKELRLTDEQKEKLHKAQHDARQELEGVIYSAKPDQQHEKYKAHCTACRDKLMGVLTDEQKAKWKELAGEPFKGELHFGKH